MALTSRHPARRSSRIRGTVLLLAAITVAACLWATPSATAATHVTAANYRMHALEYSAGNPIGNCRSWSGDADAAGHFYVACPGGTYPYFYEFDEDGQYLRYGRLPADYLFSNFYRMRDVAVSPDGNTVYVSVGPIDDHIEAGEDPTGLRGSIVRFRRQANGSWAHDTGYRVGPFDIAGERWAARYVDVDAAGRVYVSVNAYVFELDPQTGARRSFFGDGSTAWAGGPWRDGLEVVNGIAASADGRTLYVVEQKHHIVQRWVRTGATTWARDRTWGPNGNGLLGVPSVEGDQYCDTNDHFQSPYDIAVDGAGDIYVLDVSCRRVQRFSSAGRHVQRVWTHYPDGELVHGFAVNWAGSIFLPELEKRLQRLDPPARPATTPVAPRPTEPTPTAPAACTDRGAPRITAVSTTRVGRGRVTGVRVSAADDCGIRWIRVSGDLLRRPTWSRGSSQRVVLGGWNGTKRLHVTVRDAGGHVVSRDVTTRLQLPQPTLRARTHVGLGGRGCAPGNPMSRVGGAANYQLVDRCARIFGAIRSVRGTRRSMTIELLVPAHVARRMYTNAVGPVTLWVVTDGRTRLVGSPRRGRRMTIVTSLVIDKARRGAYAIPVHAARVR